MKIIVRIAQITIGLVFVISGLSKANDTQGMALLIQDYLSAWGFYPYAGSITMTVAVVTLALTEVTLGAYLLIGSARHQTARFLTLFMVVMTCLTAWSALTDAVPECGCFGSAIELSNTASFLKNIILLAASALLVWQSTLMYRLPWASSRVLITTASSIIAIGVSLWTWQTLPLIDFTPYKVGTDISTAMMGEYTVIDGKSVEVQKPSIKDFALTTPEGEDITDEILAETDTVILVTIPSEQHADTGHSNKLNTLWDKAHDAGHKFYLVMAEDTEKAEHFKDRTGLTCPMLIASQEMLQTIVRGNPGIVFLQGGHIIGKYRVSQLNDN